MKIKEMSNQQLEDAFKYMSQLLIDDPCYQVFNFDEGEYNSKLQELKDEELSRQGR